MSLLPDVLCVFRRLCHEHSCIGCLNIAFIIYFKGIMLFILGLNLFSLPILMLTLPPLHFLSAASVPKVALTTTQPGGAE